MIKPHFKQLQTNLAGGPPTRNGLGGAVVVLVVDELVGLKVLLVVLFLEDVVMAMSRRGATLELMICPFFLVLLLLVKVLEAHMPAGCCLDCGAGGGVVVERSPRRLIHSLMIFARLAGGTSCIRLLRNSSMSDCVDMEQM